MSELGFTGFYDVRMMTVKNIPKLRFPEFKGEWEKKKLGEDCNVLMCKRIFAEETSETEEIPFYKIGTLGGSPDVFISRKLFEDYKNRYNFPEKGEILITCSGTVGKCIPFDGREAYYQDSNIVWIDNPNQKIKNEFLYYVVSNFNWGKLNSTTITRIYGSDFRSLILKYPTDTNEQTRIASFFTVLDKKIAQLKQKKALLERYKKGVMQKLFSQELKFKDENGKEFSKWENKKLGEILTIGSGKDYKHLGLGEIPVFGTGGYMASVNDFLYDGETVCIGRKGTIDSPMFYKGKIWTVDTLFYTHSFKSSIPKFVYYVFQTINWKEHNEASGVPSLSKSTIEKILMPIPCLEEQTKIANFLSAIDEKINRTENQIQRTQEWKKGLLQRMFV